MPFKMMCSCAIAARNMLEYSAINATFIHYDKFGWWGDKKICVFVTNCGIPQPSIMNATAAPREEVTSQKPAK